MSPTCSCCSDRLIRHIRQGTLYWWCHSCWAEMPNMEEVFGLSTRENPALAPTAQPKLSPTLQEQTSPPARRTISMHRPLTHQVA